jgi:hypothetical protein
MNIKKSLLIHSILLFFVFTPLVFAATSSTFFPSAQKFINSNCSQKNVTQNQVVSLYCYLFYKVQEQDTQIGSINNAISPIPNQIVTLQNKVTDLQNQINALKATPIPTQSPSNPPVNANFGNNVSTGQNGPGVSAPAGYTSLTITVSSPTAFNGWSIQVSTDGGNTWLEQERFNCGGPTCQPVTIPVIGTSYRVSPGGGGTTFSAIGEFNDLSGTMDITSSNLVSLPYIFPVTTTGFSSIVITAAQTNPQNLVNIQLQNLTNNTWNVEQQLNCDGGARCPLASLPLNQGETYRVVVNGSGNNDTLIGALLSP